MRVGAEVLAHADPGAGQQHSIALLCAAPSSDRSGFAKAADQRALLGGCPLNTGEVTSDRQDAKSIEEVRPGLLDRGCAGQHELTSWQGCKDHRLKGDPCLQHWLPLIADRNAQNAAVSGRNRVLCKLRQRSCGNLPSSLDARQFVAVLIFDEAMVVPRIQEVARHVPVAAYPIHGSKPCYRLSLRQVRSHFPAGTTARAPQLASDGSAHVEENVGSYKSVTEGFGRPWVRAPTSNAARFAPCAT